MIIKKYDKGTITFENPNTKETSTKQKNELASDKQKADKHNVVNQ